MPAEKDSLEWLKSYEKEREEYASIEHESRDKLLRALNSSKILGVPNSFRTAICFELLGDIVDTFDRYKHLTHLLIDECIGATYSNPEELRKQLKTAKSTKARVYFEHAAYYVELNDQIAHREALESQIKLTNTEFIMIMQQLKNKEYMLNKTAERWGKTVLHETFHGWVKVTQTQKNTRVALGRMMKRFKQRQIKSTFIGWKQIIHSSQKEGAMERLKTLRNTSLECELLQEDLQTEIQESKAATSNVLRDVAVNRLRVQQHKERLHELQHTFEASDELKLQKIVHLWGKTCIKIVNLELTYLTNMIDAVDPTSFQNIDLLLNKQEVPLDMLQLPVDSILIRWCNYHLKRTKCPIVMQSFSSDIKSCQVLGHILASIQSDDIAAAEAHFSFSEEDVDTRENDILRVLAKLSPPCPPFLSPGDITTGQADLMFALLSFLFVKHTGLIQNVCQWDESMKALEEAKNNWKGIESIWFSSPVKNVPDMAKAFAFGNASIQQLNRAKTSLQNAIHMVQYSSAKRAATKRLWLTVRNRMEAAAWQILLHRGRGEPYQMPDLKEARERAMYTTLNIKKISTLFEDWEIADSCKEMEKIQAIFNEKYHDVKRIFVHYAASDVGDACSMSMDEFYLFLKDCKLLSKALPLSRVQKIFEIVNDEGDGIGDPLNPDFEFTPGEFIEAILHIAMEIRFPKLKKDTISHKVKKCLTDYILPNACRSNSEYFRSRLARADCKEVFAESKNQLQVVYRNYAGDNGCLNSIGFGKLLEDCKLFSPLFTREDMETVFTRIQNAPVHVTIASQPDEVIGGPDIENDLELTYTDFCGGLAAIAVYRNSDPFIKIPIKIQELLTYMGIINQS